ncbi:MAG: hypothetical protein [Bacteriophage sp.]|nr:MAG: hypothetical protein [Bacteriophage sp.]
MNPKRKKVQDYIMNLLKSVSPKDRLNKKRYTEFFEKLTDAEFDTWMNDIRSGKTKLYYIQKNGQDADALLSENDIIDTANKIGVELEQRVNIWDSSQQRYYKTPYKYLILQVPVRRLKQNLLSKMSVPDGDTKINPTTGQVVKPDKAASVSMTEAQTIASKGLSKTLTELLTVRGGDVTSYGNYKALLEDMGDVSLKELNLTNSTVRSVSVTRAYLQAMGLDNNL